MKRTAKYALTLVLGAAVVMPAVAQDNFPDVPENHWAYKELARLKAEGLLVGYPDGLFRGGRPASRYEMAVAIHAAWANLKGITDGLKGQIDDIMKRIEGQPTKADLDNLKAAIEALQNQVKVNSDDISALKRLIDEFRAELTKLGADVEQMKKDIAALDKRVTALEKAKLPFDVSGDLNLVALGGYSGHDDEFGMTVDGRPTGFGRGDYFGDPVGVTRDLTVLHEGALNMTSNNETGPKFYATFVFGNMIGDGGFLTAFPAGTGFGNQSTVNSFEPFGEAESAWYAQRFYVDFDTSVASLGFNAKVGRVGYKINNYMFKRPDVTPYYSNERWDDGEWMFDGAILGFRFGGAKLNVFGGRNSGRLATNGAEIQPMFAGNDLNPYNFSGSNPFFVSANAYQQTTGRNGLAIDQSLGAHLWLPLGDKGHINLAYLWLDSNNVVNNGSSLLEAFNRVVVYGGDVSYQIGGKLSLNGGYAKSNLQYNDEVVLDEDNSAWWVGLNYGNKEDKWGIGGGYRSIDPLYAAPGAWGRYGATWNPVDMQGFHVDGWLKLSNNLSLMGSGAFMTGRDTDNSALTEDDTVRNLRVGLDYMLNANSSLYFNWENTVWDFDASGLEPSQTWFTVGFNFGLSDKAKLKLWWQVSDMDSDGGTSGFSFFGQDRARGGLIGTQLSVKF
ncbi:MAG: S-layer homology domain-containing protein [Chlorobia bacterium]|nr:S-layer homology domain-containing protein [Fimbriimonadaceae bacterium]